MKDDCVAFLQWALPRLGMRWAGFRKVRGQVCKRIARRMAALEVSGFDGYRRHLEAHPHEWPVLDSLCRVTISRFHRDRGVFELIGRRILPELAAAAAAAGDPGHPPARDEPWPDHDPVVRCWSAGCASGEEPYTLTILWRLRLRDRFPGVRLEVLATDADPVLLGRAGVARYPASAVRELPADWVAAAFTQDGDALRLRNPFRADVDLRRQDIREEMPDGPFHLILCRSLVFTYFEAGLQARLLGRILRRLRPAGYLVLGAHEDLPRGDWPLERVGRGAVFRYTPGAAVE